MSDTPTATAPRMTEMEKWLDEIQEAILDAAADVQEGGSGAAIPMLNARHALISDLVSGKRDTLDTETEVKVSRLELESIIPELERRGAYGETVAVMEKWLR